MKCASCGERIEGTPVWMDDEAYCSAECADIGPMEDDYTEDEEVYDVDYEEEMEAGI